MHERNISWNAAQGKQNRQNYQQELEQRLTKTLMTSFKQVKNIDKKPKPPRHKNGGSMDGDDSINDIAYLTPDNINSKVQGQNYHKWMNRGDIQMLNKIEKSTFNFVNQISSPRISLVGFNQKMAKENKKIPSIEIKNLSQQHTKPSNAKKELSPFIQHEETAQTTTQTQTHYTSIPTQNTEMLSSYHSQNKQIPKSPAHEYGQIYTESDAPTNQRLSTGFASQNVSKTVKNGNVKNQLTEIFKTSHRKKNTIHIQTESSPRIHNLMDDLTKQTGESHRQNDHSKHQSMISQDQSMNQSKKPNRRQNTAGSSNYQYMMLRAKANAVKSKRTIMSIHNHSVKENQNNPYLGKLGHAQPKDGNQENIKPDFRDKYKNFYSSRMQYTRNQQNVARSTYGSTTANTSQIPIQTQSQAYEEIDNIEVDMTKKSNAESKKDLHKDQEQTDSQAELKLVSLGKQNNKSKVQVFEVPTILPEQPIQPFPSAISRSPRKSNHLLNSPKRISCPEMPTTERSRSKSPHRIDIDAQNMIPNSPTQNNAKTSNDFWKLTPTSPTTNRQDSPLRSPQNNPQKLTKTEITMNTLSNRELQKARPPVSGQKVLKPNVPQSLRKGRWTNNTKKSHEYLEVSGTKGHNTSASIEVDPYILSPTSSVVKKKTVKRPKTREGAQSAKKRRASIGENKTNGSRQDENSIQSIMYTNDNDTLNVRDDAFSSIQSEEKKRRKKALREEKRRIEEEEKQKELEQSIQMRKTKNAAFLEQKLANQYGVGFDNIAGWEQHADDGPGHYGKFSMF